MSDPPPLPPGMPTPPPPPPGMPPPPPPPGFENIEEEDENTELVENESLIEIEETPPLSIPPLPPLEVEIADNDESELEESSLNEIEPEEVHSPPPSIDSEIPIPPPPPDFDTNTPLPPLPVMGIKDESDESEEALDSISLEASLAAFSSTESTDDVVWPEPEVETFSESINALDGVFEADGVTDVDFAAAIDASSREETSLPLSINLRPAVEVDSIPGDKLFVTLKEKEEAVLNPDGSVRQQTIDGELILRNSSRKDRAWDIEVNLQNTGATDIGGASINVRELDATESTTLPYTASGPKMMILREHIDTEPERSQEPSLSMVFSPESQEILIRISVENVAPVALNDVEVRRALPDNFDLTEGAEYEIKDSELVWKIGRLPVGETATLSIIPRITTRSIQRFATGVVRASYACEATVSRSQFDSVSSRARQFGYVSPKEDDRPDVFHCKLVVENRSSFVVSLSGATVWLAGRSEPFLEMEDLREDIPPEGLWDSLEKRIETIDKPNFTHEINYSILTRANVESSGDLELKERSIKVLDASVNKQYSISRIRSYVPSNLDCTIMVENTGSAPINVIRLLDDIPGIFTPPSIEQIRIEMEGTDLKDDQFRIEVVDGTQLEEQLVSPDTQGHALRITVGTSAPLGLQAGKSLVITYPLHAEDPSPLNDRLGAPVRTDFSMERFGPVATRYCNRSPLIRVVHRRRRFSTGKEVFPAAGAGRYEILLMFQNDSDSALDDLTLHDVVPGTFTIERSTVRSTLSGERAVDYSKESAREGTAVTWPIGRIEKNERIEVVFEIQGDSESEYKVADAQDYHGATFGDEVDEEPNLPDWVDENARGIPPIIHEPISEPEPVFEEEDELEIEEAEVDISEESQVESKPSLEVELDPQPTFEAVPDICPVCGTEASIGASMCETCSYQFN